MTTGMREIVGVVADVKHQNLQGAAQPEIYFAQSQMPMSAMTVVVRAAGDPRALQRAVRGVVPVARQERAGLHASARSRRYSIGGGDAALQHAASRAVRRGRADPDDGGASTA